MLNTVKAKYRFPIWQYIKQPIKVVSPLCIDMQKLILISQTIDSSDTASMCSIYAVNLLTTRNNSNTELLNISDHLLKLMYKSTWITFLKKFTIRSVLFTFAFLRRAIMFPFKKFKKKMKETFAVSCVLEGHYNLLLVECSWIEDRFCNLGQR